MEAVKMEISDLSIREIELIMKKLENDNVTLRRELHESRVLLNDKDEEILRLGREILQQKKEKLDITRKIVALAEVFNMGQDLFQKLSSFLLGTSDDNKSEGSNYSYPGYSTGTPASGGSQEAALVPLKIPVEEEEEEYKYADAEYSPEDEHVKAPFNYQYRHLRLQVHTSSGDRVDEFSVEGHDVNIEAVCYDKME